MKNILVLLTFLFNAIFLTACGTANTAQTNTPSNTKQTASTSKSDDNSLVARSHSGSSPTTAPKTDNSANIPKSVAPPMSSGENSPMSKPVDVTELTANIEKAEKEFKAKSSDAKMKEALAVAYFERAFVLTEAAQYRAALGDFRKGLKLNPKDEKAKDMHDEIIRIFQSINRPPPKEGEEPAPLPFKKEV